MRTVEKGISVERLREAFAYDPEAGQITWKIARSFVKAGTQTGSKSGSGYLYIGIDRKRLMAHRCAWAIVYGCWPEYSVDHVNGVRDDNRLSNLRIATPSQNTRNSKCQADKIVPLKGVSATPGGTFRARIYVNGRHIYLGAFRTPELAHAAYKSAADQLFGAFARS